MRRNTCTYCQQCVLQLLTGRFLRPFCIPLMFCIPQTIKYLFNDMFISFIGIKLPMCCITIKIAINSILSRGCWICERAKKKKICNLFVDSDSLLSNELVFRSKVSKLKMVDTRKIPFPISGSLINDDDNENVDKNNQQFKLAKQ